ncbi:MAG: PAS domain S-box protein [Deltaproteobacteria bacterium]|nr:PAS domain S-box protein [Deltaproteobacteria bacterium]MBW1921994.1 PAS domain S-box protein [Deltaproteobacteria bacterium]MBW1950162.1 PAS domain S-box protein [Deltaproteobacteria bacterium]MBW2348612.1 PAS domain S-box protein [Deltaproteobacteria bacterium]
MKKFLPSHTHPNRLDSSETGQLKFAQKALSCGENDMESESSGVRRLEIIIFGTLTLFGLYLISLYNYLLMHSIGEAFIVIIAFGIFIVTWNSRKLMDNHYPLFIGLSYLFIAIVEMMHTLTCRGMGIFNRYDADLPAQLWITARYMQSFSLLIAPLFLDRRIRLNLFFGAYASATCLILLSIFLWDVFPSCLIQGVTLTPFRKISEYIICLIFLGSIVFLYQKRKEFETDVYRLLIGSIVLSIAAELAFTFDISEHGFSNLVGHYFTIISFYLIYKAMIETSLQRPYGLLFRKLKKSETSLRSIFKVAPTGIGVARDRLIQEVNEQFCKITGYSRDELVGQTARILYPTDEDYELVGKVKYRQVEEKGIGTVETRFKRKDGAIINVLLSSTPLDPTDLSVGVTFTALDITERKQAEEALRKSEVLMQRIFEASPFGICLIGKDRRIKWYNKTLTRMFGYSSGEVYGANARMLHPNDEEFKRIEEAISSLGSGKKAHDIETSCVRRDGSVFDCHIRYALINPESEESDVLAIAEDVTERKKAEEEKIRLEKELRRAQKMEAIGTLAGGIAHDFNNILAAIIGISELAQMETPEGSLLHTHLGQVLAAGLRARDLVKQILAFSRQNSEQLIPMSIHPVVKEGLKLLRSSLPTTIKINRYIKKGPELILGDPTQIHQILMNLCTNAEHAMREKGGTLDVKLERVDIDEAMAALHQHLQPGPYMRLEVSDTGKGIDPEVKDRIFDPYFTTKESWEGTGLGLAVVQGIVQTHGGAIIVESEVGKGTTFGVYFPIIEGEKEGVQEQEKVERALPTGNERILFIDDEEMLVEVGKGILEQLGYDVTVRTSSLEALELFKAKSGYFDLVITDMSMPNMTGEHLSRELMKIRPGTPIILCTGFSHVISKEKARAIGIRSFAMKPLISKDLAQTVRRVLDEKR